MRLHYIYRDFPSIAETELGTECVHVGGRVGSGGQGASRVKRETTQNRLLVLGVKA